MSFLGFLNDAANGVADIFSDPIKPVTQDEIDQAYGTKHVTLLDTNKNITSKYTPPTTVGTTGTGGSGSVSSWTPSDEANYQASLQLANHALDRLPDQLKIALGNIGAQYGQQNNALQSSKANATNTYNQNVLSNQQDRLTNSNQINQNAAQGYQSLLRLLGGMGAGGGSEAQFLVPNVVQQQANLDLGNNSQTYAKNARNLDTGYNQFLDDEKNQEKQLNDWRTQQENAARSQSASSKQNLLQQLASLNSQRVAAQGGNGVAALQPYVNKINSLADKIDAFSKFNPTFSGSTPVYNAPTLDSYSTGDMAQTQVAPTAPTGSSNPYLALLLGQQKKDQNQVLV